MKKKWNPITVFKSFNSICLLMSSVSFIIGLVASRQTQLSSNDDDQRNDYISVALAYVVLWGGLLWLTMVEATQASLVGLAPVDPELYKESHPIAYRCNKVTGRGDSLHRFLIGRQSLVCIIVFLINAAGRGPISDYSINNDMSDDEVTGDLTVGDVVATASIGEAVGDAVATTSTTSPYLSFLANHPWVKDVFLTSGLSIIISTVMVGQLHSQINASLCMLDYCNNHFALFTMWVALAIEFSGLLHVSYLLKMAVIRVLRYFCSSSAIKNNSYKSFLNSNSSSSSRVTGSPLRRRMSAIFQKVFFWIRCLTSLAILCYSATVTFVALFNGKTTMWEGIPPGVSLLLFFIFLTLVGILESMQIAFFAVAKLSPSEREQGNKKNSHSRSHYAQKTCRLLFQDGKNKTDGKKTNNLPQFMVGRQLFVVSCMFYMARVTSISQKHEQSNDDSNDPMNIFGVPDRFQSLFINTGILGSLLLTITGSIVWQMVASSFPFMILNNPLAYGLLRVCLFLDSTGVCSAAWLLAELHKKVANFQRDEVYIGDGGRDHEDRSPLRNRNGTHTEIASNRNQHEQQQQARKQTNNK